MSPPVVQGDWWAGEDAKAAGTMNGKHAAEKTGQCYQRDSKRKERRGSQGRKKKERVCRRERERKAKSKKKEKIIWEKEKDQGAQSLMAFPFDSR